MKKLLSLILAIAMVISLIPSVFAEDTATAPADVVYDFTTYTNSWSKLLYNSNNYTQIPSGLSYTTPTENGTTYYIVQPKDKNFSFVYVSTAIDWKIGLTTTNSAGGATRVNVGGNWEAGAGSSTKAAINIEVTESGWYSPSFIGGLTAQGLKASIYLTGTGEDASKTSYLGDYDFTYTGTETTSNVTCADGTEKKLNAVYLTKGTHTLYFCFRAYTDTVNGLYAFFQEFNLYGLSAEPTIAGINSAVPTEVLSVGTEKTLTAQLIDSNGDAISFGDFVTYSDKDTKNTTNYLEVTSDNEDVIKVTSYAKGGLCNSENTTYTIKAIGGGVANLEFTPHINGEKQTSYKKSVSVAGEITIDFSKSTDKGTSTPGYTINEGSGTAAGNWRKAGNYMRITTTKPDATLSNVWPTVYNKSTKATFDINVPVAGFYSVKFLGGLSTVSALGSIYANGSYAGEYDFRTDDATTNEDVAIDGTEKTLNTVYLKEGSNTFYIGIHGLAANVQPLTFIRKITLTPVDSLAGKTTIAVGSVSSTDIPTTMTVGNMADATASVTMEDGSVRSFAAWAADSPKQDTIDSVTVTSSAPDIISVESYDDDALGASDKTTFTLKANAAGSAVISITAKVGDSTKTAEYTVTVPDGKSGAAITDIMVSFKASAYTGGSVSNSNVQDVEVGKSVTVTATPNNGYTFAYWKNSAGVVLSTSATETFKVSTNTGVIAVFDKVVAEGEQIPVYFYNGNGILLGEASVDKDTTFEDAKTEAKITDVPKLTGFIFKHWSDKNEETAIADADKITALTRAVAIYEDDEDTTYTVKNGTATVATGKKYGESVTISGGDNFVCWKLGDKVISYEKNFTFNVYGDITLTEVTEGTVEKAPVLVLDNVNGKYFLTYNAGDYELVEAGILFGSSGVSIESTDGYKAAAKKGTGQFTALPHAGATESTIARGYMIFKDGDNLRVAYSD